MIEFDLMRLERKLELQIFGGRGGGVNDTRAGPTLVDSFQGRKDGLNDYISGISVNPQFELKDKTDVSLKYSGQRSSRI